MRTWQDGLRACGLYTQDTSSRPALALAAIIRRFVETVVLGRLESGRIEYKHLKRGVPRRETWGWNRAG